MARTRICLTTTDQRATPSLLHATRQFATALMAGCLLALAVPVPSQAVVETLSQPSELEAANQDGIDQYVARKFGITTDQSCNRACQLIESNQARIPTNPQGAATVEGEAFRGAASGEISAAPKFLPPLRALPIAGAVTLTIENYRVWRWRVFGARPRQYILRTPVAAGEPAEWKWSDPTDPAFNPAIYLSTYERPSPLPHGLVAWNNSQFTIMFKTGAQDCRQSAPELASDPRIQTFSWWWNECYDHDEKIHSDPDVYEQVTGPFLRARDDGQVERAVRGQPR